MAVQNFLLTISIQNQRKGFSTICKNTYAYIQLFENISIPSALEADPRKMNMNISDLSFCHSETPPKIFITFLTCYLIYPHQLATYHKPCGQACAVYNCHIHVTNAKVFIGNLGPNNCTHAELVDDCNRIHEILQNPLNYESTKAFLFAFPQWLVGCSNCAKTIPQAQQPS